MFEQITTSQKLMQQEILALRGRPSAVRTSQEISDVQAQIQSVNSLASSIVLPTKKVEWSQIEPLISNQKDQAFRVALSSRSADSDSSQMVNVIRLMCRTGVCLDSISD